MKHPLYGKIIRRSKKYHAHDEGNEFKQGETVRIEETRPISKLKTWTVIDRVDTHATPERRRKRRRRSACEDRGSKPRLAKPRRRKPERVWN